MTPDWLLYLLVAIGWAISIYVAHDFYLTWRDNRPNNPWSEQ